MLEENQESNKSSSINSYVSIIRKLPSQESSSPPCEREKTLSVAVDNSPVDNSKYSSSGRVLTPKELGELFEGYSPTGYSPVRK